MKKLGLLLAIGLLVPALAHAFTVHGRFLYEDRMWDKDGYTGTTQDLPVRHARVDVINAVTQLTIGTGSTDSAGFFAVSVTGQIGIIPIQARVVTDGRPAGYEIRVVDELVRGLGEPAVIGNLHAVSTPIVLNHNVNFDYFFNPQTIQDTDGTGVAQAFNIFDNAVDFFQWMALPIHLNRLPNASEYVIFAWSPTSANEGSNYSGHAILISSPGQGNDTDGWSDTVILHETGHWFDDFFSRSDNPGGAHSLGDNNQVPTLSYGEGVATFHCAKVRDHRARTRGIDNHVSIYGDLMIPPALPASGGLSFSYDFETGVAYIPAPFFLGQRGTANETNVTSAQWDLVDAPDTMDETPGVDDDAVAVSTAVTWNIERNYLPSLAPGNPVTVEDYYQGWFAQNGAGFMKSSVDHIFVTLALMEFYEDSAEPDNTIAGAGLITPLAHAASGSHVVINEIDPGAQDAVELYNPTTAAVDLTGWQLQVYVNGDAAPVVSRIYVFPAFTLQPGEVVAVYERGDPLNNGAYHLYAGTTPNAFNMSWAHGGDGAVVLRNASNAPVDFVTWGGNTEPVPAGTAFTGVLASPASPPTNLARDIDGTDTDAAADFTHQTGSLASVNHPAPVHRTLYGTGDQDVMAFTATAGTRYGFEAHPVFSASDPHLEILTASGTVLGSNDNSDVGVRDARLDFYASTSGTFYLRVKHVGPYTDWAAYDIAAFERPIAAVFAPPSSINATADNGSDVADPVVVRWLNSGAYDSVRVYRNGALLATLPGAPGEYHDSADRGVYRYEVSGMLGGMETSRASGYEFAGLIGCTASDDFEAGNADQWITDGSSWGVTPFAEAGVFGFTDSPAGTYQGCPTGSGGCTNNAIAVFRVPAFLPPGSVLTWDQICITEHCDGTPCDICVVEISTNEGGTWTELARYDQASDPAWGDNVADPTDWRPASVDLSAYQLEYVLIRFRLQSDALLELDGWYVDNVMINDGGCSLSGVEMEPVTARLSVLPPYPNPMRGASRLTFVLPTADDKVSVAVFDVAGRLVHQAPLGRLDAGSHSWTWDGSDDSGAAAPAGMYFTRLTTSAGSKTHKVLKVAE